MTMELFPLLDEPSELSSPPSNHYLTSSDSRSQGSFARQLRHGPLLFQIAEITRALHPSFCS